MKRFVGSLPAAIVSLLSSLGPASAAVHVDPSAPGSADGSSWENAFTDLQVAIAAATPGDSILVAAGTYNPGFVQEHYFPVPSGVVTLGSFGGFSSPNPDARDFDATPSILSGEIGAPERTDNCFNVFKAFGTVAGTKLDGFVVTRGHAWGPVGSGQRGAGLYFGSGTLIVSNVRFVDNQSQSHGAGMYSEGDLTLEHVEFKDGMAGAFSNGHGGGLYATGATQLTDCQFLDNAAENQGGGIFVWNTSATLERCVFERNSAKIGGGLRTGNGGLTLVNVEFRYNSASDDGGALSSASGSEGLQIVNGLFWRNSAVSVGGAVYLGGFGTQEFQELTNCTFAENEAGTSGAFYVFHNGTPQLTNCIFWANSGDWGPPVIGGDPRISHSIVAGSGGSGAWDPTFGIDGGGNLDVDPAFEFMVLGNMRLMAGSPAIDAGDPNAPNLPLQDLDGNPRVLGATVDMGVYEFVGPVAVGPFAGSFEFLRAIRPNPAHQDVNISFELPRSSDVRVAIYDVRGRLVRQLVRDSREAGVHHVVWNREGARGPAAPGVYFVRVDAAAMSETRRIVVLR